MTSEDMSDWVCQTMGPEAETLMAEVLKAVPGTDTASQTHSDMEKAPDSVRGHQRLIKS